tara:strand:- start:22 stop:534 length:513 start_codon:yes stop_codon:yes gene_type:complete
MNVKDLIDFGSELRLLLDPLFEHFTNGTTPSAGEASKQANALEKITKALSEAQRSTSFSRADAIGALYEAKWVLEDSLDLAQHTPFSFSQTRSRAMKRKIEQLDRHIAQARELQALNAIATVLTNADLAKFKAEVAAAQQAVEARQDAQKTINTLVDVAVVAGKIAMKLI